VRLIERKPSPFERDQEQLTKKFQRALCGTSRKLRFENPNKKYSTYYSTVLGEPYWSLRLIASRSNVRTSIFSTKSFLSETL
jgi:hypothetical protein